MLESAEESENMLNFLYYVELIFFFKWPQKDKGVKDLRLYG